MFRFVRCFVISECKGNNKFLNAKQKHDFFCFVAFFFRDINPILLQNRYFCDIIQLSMLSHFVRCKHSYRSIYTFTSFDMNIHIVRCEVTKVAVSDN